MGFLGLDLVWIRQRRGGINGGGGGYSSSRSSIFGFGLTDDEFASRSGLTDAHWWYEDGAQGSGEGALAG